MINAAELVAIALPVSVAATTALSTPTRIAAAALAGQEAQVAAQRRRPGRDPRARLEIDAVRACYDPERARGGVAASGRRRGRWSGCPWLGLVILALPCVVYAMDLSVLDLALPSLSHGPRSQTRRANKTFARSAR